MTLLKDVITIPEAVHKGDFVMSLASGVADSAGTLENYVVTPQLADAYDNALRFIASAINENKSKAAYLDGSFGSGKSHFMAVLHLLLQRDPGARAIPELGEAIAASDGTLSKCSFALVPFHMIGAESMEQAIFGGYVRHLREADAEGDAARGVCGRSVVRAGGVRARPARRRGLLRRAERGARRRMAAGGATSRRSWDATSYEQARVAAVGDPNRGRLGGAIVSRFMPGYVKALSGNPEGYVDLDTGLAELARHAQGPRPPRADPVPGRADPVAR